MNNSSYTVFQKQKWRSLCVVTIPKKKRRRKSEREFELNLKKVSSLYTQNSRKKKVITYLFLEEHIDQNEIRRTSVSGRRVSRDRRFHLRLFEENLQRTFVLTSLSLSYIHKKI